MKPGIKGMRSVRTHVVTIVAVVMWAALSLWPSKVVAATFPHVELLRDADIILQKSKTTQSAALRAATHSPYTHVGLVFIRDGSPWVLEAAGPVKWTPLSEWIEKGQDKHVVVVRSRTPLTTDEASAVKRAAEAFLKRDYDGLFQWSDDRIYCSELVYKAYQTGLNRKAGALVPLSQLDLEPEPVRQLIAARVGRDLDTSEPVVAPVSVFDAPGFWVVLSTDPLFPPPVESEEN